MGKMPLEGYRVADWSVAVAGPSAAMWLASFGAEVIKIESRDGDTMRAPASGRPSAVYPTVGMKVKAVWETMNHSKKSLTVDLSKEEGREIIYRLVKTLDVFSHNRVPDTAKKLGVDYETLVKYNPRLIYCAGNIYGSKGPLSSLPGSDVLGHAISGIMTTSGGSGDPLTWGTAGITDFGQGFSAFSGIVTALLHRERTGESQKVEVSQLQAGMNIYHLATLSHDLLVPKEIHEQDLEYNGGNYTEYRWPRQADKTSPAHTYYQCKDDKWIVISGQGGKQWKELCRALGQPELESDPMFATPDKRHENCKELFDIFAGIIATKTQKEWYERFQECDCGFAPVNRLRDLPNEPQVIANDLLYTVDHPVAGRVHYPGPPFSLSKTPSSVRSLAPGLGEHSDGILQELGYSPEEIVELHESKVV